MEINEQQLKMNEFVSDIKVLLKIASSLEQKLSILIKQEQHIPIYVLNNITLDVTDVTQLYHKMAAVNEFLFSSENNGCEKKAWILGTAGYRHKIWMKKIILQYKRIIFTLQTIIKQLLCQYDKDYIGITLLLLNSFNMFVSCGTIFKPTNESTDSSVSVSNVKRFSLVKILQLIADIRKRICAMEIIEDLRSRYTQTYDKPYSIEDSVDNEIAYSRYSTEMQEDSDNTSIVIYKTLTQYITPPKSPTVEYKSSHISESSSSSKSICKPSRILINKSLSDDTAFYTLVLRERSKLCPLLSALATIPNDLVSEFDIISCNKSYKLKSDAQSKITATYERILWAKVGIISEHIFLWWAQYAVGVNTIFPSQRVQIWLQQFLSKVKLPDIVAPVLWNIADSLHCYITSTHWDELFRQVIISVTYQHSRHVISNIGLGTKSGHLFSDVFYDLVYLNNDIENDTFMCEQDADNIPIVEQIPVLHRLDHSIHVARMWSNGRAKYLTNCWNMEQFFRITHTDINASLYALNQLKMNKLNKGMKGNVDEHFIVCSKMREKLISEINTNIDKFKAVPTNSLSILASVCHVTSSARLRIIFPEDKYWSQHNNSIPKVASNYVKDYLDEVLKPVIFSSQNLPFPNQKSVSMLILTIVCEAWLDYIYSSQIKFSEWGALQLLVDFNMITIWIKDSSFISNEIAEFLTSGEILKRCKGAANLLLRKPGECIFMMNPKNPSNLGVIDNKNEEQEIEENQNIMPLEMYVTNQQHWLMLRANRTTKNALFCC